MVEPAYLHSPQAQHAVFLPRPVYSVPLRAYKPGQQVVHTYIDTSMTLLKEEIFHGHRSRGYVLTLYGSARFLGLRSLGGLLFFVVFCRGFASFRAVLYGAERLSGGS